MSSRWLIALVALATAFSARRAIADCNAPNPEERDRVELRTPIAPICFDLLGDPNEAPLTVANFLNYVDDGDYDGSFFHRLASGFVLQGGGFRYDPVTRYSEVPEDPPVTNEPGISNTRGTVAMAKIGNMPNSATNQFYINLVDNSNPLDTTNGGFTVFARVVPEDMAVVDLMGSLPIEVGRFAIDADPAIVGALSSMPMLRPLKHKRHNCLKLKTGLRPDGSPNGTENCSSNQEFLVAVAASVADLDPQVPERLVTVSDTARDPAPLCPPTPDTCQGAAKASLSVRDTPVGKESLKLSLSGFSSATTQADFGNPATGTSSYAVCVYDGEAALVSEVAVERAGLLCGTAKKLAPCWKAQSSKGYTFKDASGLSDGVRTLTATSGVAGKGKLALKASNDTAKGQISLETGLPAALVGSSSALVQVHAGADDCYSATLGSVKKSNAVEFSATTP